MHPIFKKATVGVVILTAFSFYGFAAGIEPPAPMIGFDISGAVEVLGQTHTFVSEPPSTDRYYKLIADLESGPSWSRGLAAQLLGGMGDRRAVSSLTRALSGSDPWVATKAAEALGKLGSRQAVPELLVALRQGHPTVRRESCRALAMIGDPRSQNALIAASHDASGWVKQIATAAISKI